MPNLFDEKRSLAVSQGEVWYWPQFLSPKVADRLFQNLLTDVPWQQDNISVFGKTYAQPRLTALYGNNGKSYSYSNITMHPHPFTEELGTLKATIDTVCKTNFTTCLLNLYRNGQDSNGWHSDDEKELGQNPVIASLSLGHERFFHLRHKKDKTKKHKILLEHGSLLLMQGATQHHWQHQIAKTARKIGQRINLTFRVVR